MINIAIVDNEKSVLENIYRNMLSYVRIKKIKGNTGRGDSSAEHVFYPVVRSFFGGSYNRLLFDVIYNF